MILNLFFFFGAPPMATPSAVSGDVATCIVGCNCENNAIRTSEVRANTNIHLSVQRMGVQKWVTKELLSRLSIRAGGRELCVLNKIVFSCKTLSGSAVKRSYLFFLSVEVWESSDLVDLLYLSLHQDEGLLQFFFQVCSEVLQRSTQTSWTKKFTGEKTHDHCRRMASAIFRWFEVGCTIWAQMSQIGVSQIKAPIGSIFQKYVYSTFMVKMRIDLGSFGLFWFIFGWG